MSASPPPSYRPLSRIPREIFEHIAYYACTSSPLGPPSNLVSLLQVSRTTHSILSFHNNKDFHARLFRFKFDISAAIRRFKYSRWDDDRQRLNSKNLAEEFKRRFVGMKRMRMAVARGDLISSCSEEHILDDLWMCYLMLVESDGLNMDQLLHYAELPAYIMMYQNQELVTVHNRPGFPLDRVDRSLALWLLWFMSDAQSIMRESERDWKISFDLLRTYVFAPHKYDAFFAPWRLFRLPPPEPDADLDFPTTPSLPFATPLSPTPPLTPLPQPSLQIPPHLLADLTPIDKHVLVPHYGLKLPIHPPLLSHAAILSFFARLQRFPIVDPENGLFDPGDEMRERGEHIKTRWGKCRDSRAYDADFMRMTSCLNPMTSITDPNFFQPGMLSGDWEGLFAFVGFETYEALLQGDSDSLNRPHQLGQQPQVWRIQENYYTRPYRPPSSSSSPSSPIFEDGPIPIGSSLHAHLPHDLQLHKVSGGINASWDEGNSSAYYKTYDGAGWTEKQLFGGEGVECWADPYGKVLLSEDGDGGVGLEERVWNGGSRRREGLVWADVSASLREEEMKCEVGDEKVVDIILTGTAIPNELQGHSAWGTFSMIGRVREWDGMVTILKQYNGPDSRGEWLYRGYILANGNWIGRWRDTFTAENMHGYEGVFAMTRRAS